MKFAIVVLVACIAYANAGLISTPLVATHSVSHHSSVQSHPSPVVHAVPVVKTIPVVHAAPVVPVVKTVVHTAPIVPIVKTAHVVHTPVLLH
ncbi:cuticle protein LPCP-23-like [Harmonia axyridis]|uniref:cuticle protein LPCP-23-like n=1 Tax=Harmonia axyridis TaxID=115357 RepID=UPI001E275EFB|nr:cuticle protein LPCP-23-like [Harmonia axyridis]